MSEPRPALPEPGWTSLPPPIAAGAAGRSTPRWRAGVGAATHNAGFTRCKRARLGFRLGQWLGLFLIAVGCLAESPALPPPVAHDGRQCSVAATMAARNASFAQGNEAVATPTRPQAPASPAAPLFAQGTRLWSVRLGRTLRTPLGRVRLSQWHHSVCVRDGLEHQRGLTLGLADATQTDGGLQGGYEHGIRRHVWRRQRWTAFYAGSFGLVLHENPWTPESLRFNFDIQGGVGFTRRLNRRLLLQAGCHWYHLSNARVRGKDQNLGYDSPLFYFGLIGRR